MDFKRNTTVNLSIDGFYSDHLYLTNRAMYIEANTVVVYFKQSLGNNIKMAGKSNWTYMGRTC